MRSVASPFGVTPSAATSCAVSIATSMKARTPASDVFEADPTPQTPWPEVQPFPTRVPIPTKCHRATAATGDIRSPRATRVDDRVHGRAEDDAEREHEPPVTRGDVLLEPRLAGDVRERRFEERARAGDNAGAHVDYRRAETDEEAAEAYRLIPLGNSSAASCSGTGSATIDG